MTGNTNKWRKPLALVASVATLATMGLVAGTANAAVVTSYVTAAKQYTVTFVADDATSNSVTVNKGDSVADALAAAEGTPRTPRAWAGKFNQAANRDKFAGWTEDGETPFDFDAAITNNVTLNPLSLGDTALVKVTVKGLSYDGAAYGPSNPINNADGSYSYYVKPNTTLGSQLTPRDKGGDGKALASFTVTDGNGIKVNSGSTEEELAATQIGVPGKNELTITATTGAAKTVTVDPDANNSYLRGAYADGQPNNQFVKDVAYKNKVTLDGWVDVVNADKQVWPSKFTYGSLEAPYGTAVEVTDNYLFTPSSDVTTHFVVKFLKPNGSLNEQFGLTDKVTYFGTEYGILDKDQRATLQGDKDWTTKAWKLVSGDVYDTDKLDHSSSLADADFENDKNYTDPTKDPSAAGAKFHLYSSADLLHAAFSQDVTFQEVTGGTTSTLKVTFEDTNYAGRNESVTVEGKGGEYLDSSKFPTWTREGYILANWQIKGGTTEFGVDTLLGVYPFSTDFTVVPNWVKVDGSVLDAALAYIKPADRSQQAYQYFTSETWNNFKATYKKVEDEKQKLEYPATDNKVSDTDAARLVSELKAAWEQLKIDAKGNPTLDASTAGEQNEFVYRLHNGGLRLYSQTPVEVLAAQKTGWTLDNGYLFRAAPKAASKDPYILKYADFSAAAAEALGLTSDPTKVPTTGNAATQVNDLAGKLDAVADPIIKRIERFSSPNGTDWVYVASTGTAEINSLKRGGWNHEGVAYVVPTFGGTPVVRFALNGQHLMSTGATEQAALQRAGWTREGVAFRGL